MTTALAVKALDSSVIESLVVRGDLSGLNAQAKSSYYMQLCESLGLSPASKPFDVIKFQGKEVMYANKGCAEQLRYRQPRAHRGHFRSHRKSRDAEWSLRRVDGRGVCFRS
jgi:tRNA(His) 5'-end guanylyltransferase